MAAERVYVGRGLVISRLLGRVPPTFYDQYNENNDIVPLRYYETG